MLIQHSLQNSCINHRQLHLLLTLKKCQVSNFEKMLTRHKKVLIQHFYKILVSFIQSCIYCSQSKRAESAILKKCWIGMKKCWFSIFCKMPISFIDSTSCIYCLLVLQKVSYKKDTFYFSLKNMLIQRIWKKCWFNAFFLQKPSFFHFRDTYKESTANNWVSSIQKVLILHFC